MASETNSGQSFPGAEGLDKRELRLCRGLDVDGDGAISPREAKNVLDRSGLALEDDPRLHEMAVRLADLDDSDSLSYSDFMDVAQPNIILLEQALCGELIIPDFKHFTDSLEDIFQDVLAWSEELRHRDKTDPSAEGRWPRFGEVAAYIPPLAEISPDKWGAAVCTVDGQRWSTGDASEEFSVQSICKPINYCQALQANTAESVQRWVGIEPSGKAFNEVEWDYLGRPHNPLINAGAIMCSALICRERVVDEALEEVLELWRKMTGARPVGLDASVAQGEEEVAYQNVALANLMKSADKYPDYIASSEDLNRILKLYFNTCAITASAENMAIVGATLANYGLCPVAPSGEEQVLAPSTTRQCLSVTSSCGMYDASGGFAFDMGFPAKSGVGGGILIVIPGVMGICTWSPPLDRIGNSVRGLEFCRRLVERFSVHAYESAVAVKKSDPRARRLEEEIQDVNELTWAASEGDLGAMKRVVARRAQAESDLLEKADYDGRTPLHLASAEGKLEIVEYLLEDLRARHNDLGTAASPRDRWGGTPLDDAERSDPNGSTARLLREVGATNGESDQLLRGGTVEQQTEAAASDLAEIIECIWAAAEGDLHAVQRFIARGVSADARDYDARTPLHLAASEGRAEVCAYLARQVSTLEPKDRWGQTPLDDARRGSHEPIAQLIEDEIQRRMDH